MPKWDRLKDERTAIYLDIILGIIISSISVFSIIFHTITGNITSFSLFYVIGLVFWIGWLGFSIILMLIGIKSYYNEKHFELTGKHKKARKIKAPIIS